MRYLIQLQDKNKKTRRMLDVLGCLYPFSALSDREKEIFSEFLNEYLKLKDKLSKEDIFIKVFSYNFTKYISEVLSIKDNEVTMSSIRNYITKLRKKGFFIDKTIDSKFLDLFDKIDNEIIFTFDIKE